MADPVDRARWDEIELFAALRTSDARGSAGSFDPVSLSVHVTPVPRMISRASANMLYGSRPSSRRRRRRSRRARLHRVRERSCVRELVRGAMIASSEGEVYGRIVVAPAMLDAPIIEFVSGGSHPALQWTLPVSAQRSCRMGRRAQRRLSPVRNVRSRIDHVRSLSRHADVDRYRPVRARFVSAYEGREGNLDRHRSSALRLHSEQIDADPTRGFSDYRGLEERFLR
jgi:hypothetical protein